MILNKARKISIAVLKQSVRFVKLYHPSLMHNQYFIIVHDGVQAMGNGYYGRIFKSVTYNFLNQTVCFVIHIGSGFVQYYNLAFLQQCTC